MDPVLEQGAVEQTRKGTAGGNKGDNGHAEKFAGGGSRRRPD